MKLILSSLKLTLIAFLYATALPLSAATPSAPTIEGCFECHTSKDLNRHTWLKDVSEKNCSNCHQHNTNHAAPAIQNAPHQKNVPAPTSERRFPPGMSMPAYYNETRIGAEPNEMVFVPGGKFIRGTNNRLPDEGPEHIAEVTDFLIDKYEVTNLQYKKFIDATQRRSPKHFRNRTFPQGKSDHPVTYVTWYDAKTYCEWANKRLPTDKEWEKAARSEDGRMFPWGNDFKMHAANTPQRWQELKQEGDTSPVGAFPEGISPYGAYDMSGNVWEWTESWYFAYPGNTRESENYGEVYKTLKGGSWWDCSFYKCGISAPVFNRSFFYRSTKNKSFGFRCAKDVEKEHKTTI